MTWVRGSESVEMGGMAMNMGLHAALRMIAGVFVLLSVALGYFVSPYFLLFTAFVGLNLVQSAFTGWCPMITLLRKAGLDEEGVSPTTRVAV